MRIRVRLFTFVRIRIRILLIIEVMRISDHWQDPLFEPPRTHCERPRPRWLPPQLLNYYFDADPDPALDLVADPDPAFRPDVELRNDADPDHQRYIVQKFDKTIEVTMESSNSDSQWFNMDLGPAIFITADPAPVSQTNEDTRGSGS
jgi:hypothetical protein